VMGWGSGLLPSQFSQRGCEWEVFRLPAARCFGKSERVGCWALVLSRCSDVPVAAVRPPCQSASNRCATSPPQTGNAS
jgi:hypothetical protein